MASTALHNRRVIDALCEGLLVVDANGAVLDFNARALELLGLTAETARGIIDTDLPWHVPGASGAALPSVEVRRTRQPVARRVALKAPGDGSRVLAVRAVPLLNAAGALECVVVLFSDVTEEVAREREFEALRCFEGLSADVRAVVSASDGRILHLDEGAQALLGTPVAQVVGRSVLDFLHPEDVKHSHVPGPTGIAEPTQLRLRQPGGGWRWVEVRAKRFDSPTWGDVWFARGVDVTELKHCAEDLQKCQRQLADAQDVAHLGTWEADVSTRHFELSGRARRLLELPGPDGAAVPLDALVACFPPEERARVEAALERALAGEAVVLQTRVRSTSGVTRDLRLRTREGVPGGRVFGVLQDVSEQVRLDATLQTTERMASIGTLAAGVAHEINNPLAYVLSNLTVALHELRALRARGSDDFTELITALEEAREGAERVKTIVADLRSFARVDEQRRVPCDVAQVLSAALNMARNETRHRARVVTHFEPTGPVLANEARLGQLFLNLIINAAQAIPDGHVDENTISVTTREQGGAIIVTVTDTGCGIAPEHLPRIFDPFFSTKAVGEGTGLGLFIARNIVRDLGGTISVDSTPGLGTTFEVRLPAAVVPWQQSTPSPPPVAFRASVLVVDDEPLMLKALSRMLSRAHTLTLAGSGREALEILERGQRFDAVLCDMMMPDVSGLDVWERLGTLDPAQRRCFIFMTGGTFTERARRFLEEVRPPVLEKPFTASAFANLLAQLMALSH